MIAENSASSSSYDVRMSAAISGARDRISRQTSMPEPSGSRPSRTATSGRRAGMRRVASAAEPGLADDLDVAVGLEQVAQPAPDDLVVVEQEDADRPAGGRGVQRGVHGSGLADRRASLARRPPTSASIRRPVMTVSGSRSTRLLPPGAHGSSTVRTRACSAGSTTYSAMPVTTTLQPVRVTGSSRSDLEGQHAAAGGPGQPAAGPGGEHDRVVQHREGDRDDCGQGPLGEHRPADLLGAQQCQALPLGEHHERAFVLPHACQSALAVRGPGRAESPRPSRTGAQRPSC